MDVRLNKTFVYSPNIKNIGIGTWDKFLDWLVNDEGGGSKVDVPAIFQRVAWLYRGVLLRAQGIANIPFIIESESGAEIDNSADYQNAVEFLPRPKSLLYLMEASRTLTGKGYLWNARNRVMTKSVRFLNPQSITPEITEENGLEYFWRQLRTGRKRVEIENIVYTWMLDPFVELGEPRSFPAQAALSASGVLLNLDRFVEQFFARGAIKAQLVSVKGNPPQPEKDRIKEWFKRMMSGIANAWSTEVVSAEGLTTTTIGEGVKELENQQLSDEKRRDIAGALMIPQTKLFSSDASGIGGGGVVAQDDLNFLNECIIPEFDAIAEDWNEQLFLPNGYRLKPTYENMDAFHDDEAALAQTANGYADLLEKCKTMEAWELICAMSGIEYDEVMAQRVFALKEERRAEMQVSTPAPPFSITKPEPPLLLSGEDEKTKALKHYERKQYYNWAKQHGGNGQVFEFKYLNPAEQSELVGEARGSETPFPFQVYRQRYESLSRRSTESDL